MYKNYLNIPVLYRFLRGLEELSDEYKNLIHHFSKKQIKADKIFLHALKEINDLLKDFHNTYYKPKDEKIEDLINKSNKINNLIKENCEKKHLNFLYIYLYSINSKIKSLISSIIELGIL